MKTMTDASNFGMKRLLNHLPEESNTIIYYGMRTTTDGKCYRLGYDPSLRSTGGVIEKEIRNPLFDILSIFRISGTCPTLGMFSNFSSAVLSFPPGAFFEESPLNAIQHIIMYKVC